FQAEDGIRDRNVTGVQTCALPIFAQELVTVFDKAGFNSHGIAAHLDPQATEALYRGEPAAVEVATAHGSQMDLLIRLFLLHEPRSEERRVGKGWRAELAGHL